MESTQIDQQGRQDSQSFISVRNTSELQKESKVKHLYLL
jgi:hypothetical protein